MMENVISAIKTKFPATYKKKIIYVQQDIAKPHFSDNDADIVARGFADGLKSRFKRS